jgi:hypothetical protein
MGHRRSEASAPPTPLHTFAAIVAGTSAMTSRRPVSRFVAEGSETTGDAVVPKQDHPGRRDTLCEADCPNPWWLRCPDGGYRQ